MDTNSPKRHVRKSGLGDKSIRELNEKKGGGWMDMEVDKDRGEERVEGKGKEKARDEEDVRAVSEGNGEETNT